MKTSPCTCRHCKPAETVTTDDVKGHPPVPLPDAPCPFRVHHDGRVLDCVLHPDGIMTAVFMGQQYKSLLSFDAMRERNWFTAHIEWEPAAPDPIGAPSQEGAEDDAGQLDLAE